MAFFGEIQHQKAQKTNIWTPKLQLIILIRCLIFMKKNGLSFLKCKLRYIGKSIDTRFEKLRNLKCGLPSCD
eukprot:UN09545